MLQCNRPNFSTSGPTRCDSPCMAAPRLACDKHGCLAAGGAREGARMARFTVYSVSLGRDVVMFFLGTFRMIGQTKR